MQLSKINGKRQIQVLKSFLFLLLVIFLQLQTVTLGDESKAPSKINLSNPALRSQAVAQLAQKNRTAKTVAWNKAKKAGWRVKGEVESVVFELMAIKDGRPVYNITNNVNAAISTATNLIRYTDPYNLDGSGLTIGIWDAGSVRSTHQEFDSRVNVIDGVGSHFHSTHVGGTIGAAGVDSSAKGMSPNVNIDSYDWDLDTSEMTSRAASYPEEPDKIYISNHSYGIATGWIVGNFSGNYGFHWFGTWGDREADGFGQYSSLAADWDSICYAAPYYLPFKSAGNDRNDDAPSEGTTFYYYDGGNWQSKGYNSSVDPYDDGWESGGFDTIPHCGNAKNILTVGTVSDAVYMGERSLSSAAMASFSGWGPTDDGRIKPDIVANGISLYSSTANSDTSYAIYSGTSMSAPDASGSAVLLLQYYCELFPDQAMRASTLKALIIHTADDLGNTGPDYSFGWGLMNAKAAADQIKDHNDHPSANKIVEGLLNATNSTDSYTFSWDCNSAIRATLCWIDPAGNVLEELDNPSPRLVNDLYLRIIDPNGTIYYPFVLDTTNPAAPATTGDNTLDNVEQILISSPSIAGTYSVEVSYNGTLTNNEQYYSIIISGQHHMPSPAGIINLNKNIYSCNDMIEMELRDGDLAGNGTQDILVSTDDSDSEIVTLDETVSGVFMGTIPTAPEPANSEDGTLQIAHGQIITATYYDANDGTGNPATAIATAAADCQDPIIFNVQIDALGSVSNITFETDEPATGRVLCGLACGGPYTIEGNDSNLATSHTIKLSGLTPETDYFLIVEANDVVGNMAVDSNDGNCYSFTTAAAGDIYVPSQYATIQEAIDNSWDGGTVWIADGTYTGAGNRDIDFNGKAITVRSENGQENCIIDCQGTSDVPHRGFYFHSGENANSVVAGLTITNGYAINSLPYGGGIYCNHSNPTITQCKIENNYSKFRGGGMYNYYSSPTITDCTFNGNSVYGQGGGMYNYESSSPIVTNCTFSGNSAMHAGGMFNQYNSSPTVTNCTFSDNYTSHTAAGLRNRDDSSPTVSNCMFIRNHAGSYSGGIRNEDSSCNPTVSSCIFIGNTAYDQAAYGGALGTLSNCTLVGNSALNKCGGVSGSSVVITNCILWNNSDNDGLDESAQIKGTPAINYSCVMGWTGNLGGTGNIDTDPRFVYPTADNYHLLPTSPCINSGDPNYIVAPDETDIDSDPRVVHGRVDVGADEFTSILEPLIEVSPTEFEFSANVGGTNPEVQILSIRNIGESGILSWQVVEGCPWLEVEPNSGQSDGEIDMVIVSVNILEMNSGFYNCELAVTAEGVTNSPQTVSITLHIFDGDGVLHVPSEYGTIQAAINAAIDGEVIIISEGIYTGEGNRDIDFKGKAITVRSTDTYNPNVVAATIIDCNGTESEPHRAFRFDSDEGADSVVAGLTITNGYGPAEMAWPYYESVGGAIYCRNSNLTIKYCKIVNNEASYLGGGMYNVDSNITIIDCTFSGNLASYGAAMCNNTGNNLTIIDCNFIGNSTTYVEMGRGGAIDNLESTLMLTNCKFIDNVADSLGGGVHNSYSTTAIDNCMFSGNHANFGGGIDNRETSNLTINKCIISGNSAMEKGGGIFDNADNMTIKNSIVTNNKVIGKTLPNGWGWDSYGGGIYSDNGTIINCIIADNECKGGGRANSDYVGADAYGGGICNSFRIENCTIVNNTVVGGDGSVSGNAYGDGIYNATTIIDCIIWGNGDDLYYCSATYSCIEDNDPGTGNINSDPCFVSGLGGDYYLSQTAAGQAVDSPCMDAGSDTAAYLGMAIYTTRTDQYGDEGIVDMGYHYPPMVLIGEPDINYDFYVDLLDFGFLAVDWLLCSDPCDSNGLPGDIMIDGCVDINDLAVLSDYWLDCLVPQASNPSPADNAPTVDPNGVLIWSPGYGAVSHDVYFGTDYNDVNGADVGDPNVYMSNQAATNYDPCGLDLVTTYYWRIDEIGARCMKKGDVWGFTTWAEFDPNLGLVGWWKFEEGSGTDANDSSGNGNDGTLIGDPNWVTGKIGSYALDFDGDGDYVQIPDDDSLTPSSEITIAYWLYNRGGQDAGIFKRASCPDQPASPGASRAYVMKVADGTGKLTLRIFSPGDDSDAIESNNAVTLNQWHHIAGTFDQGEAAVYIDGQLDNSDTMSVSSIWNDAQPLIIGGQWEYCGDDSFLSNLNGKADDVRIYNRALTGGEIEQLYQQGGGIL